MRETEMRMNRQAEATQAGIEQGMAEVAQLLAIGTVRVLVHDDVENKVTSEPVRAETLDDGLEDS